MNIQRFHASTSREALAKARMAFGDGTLILSNRPTAQGVEVLATAQSLLSALDATPAHPPPPPPPPPRLPRPTPPRSPGAQSGGARHRTTGDEHPVVSGLRARAHVAPPP